VNVECDCGNNTFHLVFAPPLRVAAVCAECGERTEVGGAGRDEAFPGGGDGP